MSWQDELRRLDEELATGQISADDYRLRRDAVMASAVSPAANPAPTPGESTTVMPQIPTGQQPLGHTGDPDKTQIVSGRSADVDRTQAVGGWVATPPPPDDPNRTQIVPGVPPQAYVGARPPRPAPGFDQNQPPWQNEEPLPPSWSGEDFPPFAANNSVDWTLQGPEVFESEKKSGAGKVFGIIGIVVVLLGIAAGAYFLFRPDDNNNQAGPGGQDDTSTSEPATTTSAKPKGPIAELPGDQQNMSKVKTFAQVEAIDYLTPQEIDIYRQGGASDAAVAISIDSDVRIIVVVVTMQSPEAAVAARDALATLQLNFSLVARESEPGVVAAGNPNASNGPLLRAHYASEDKVVRIQTQGEDGDAADELFDQVIIDQLERLPADG
jgi:hypothetical protein